MKTKIENNDHWIYALALACMMSIINSPPKQKNKISTQKDFVVHIAKTNY